MASERILFNLSTGSRTYYTFGNREPSVFSFAFSADGRFFASGSLNAACDPSAHQTAVQLIGHTDHVPSAAFFPDDKQIMWASHDGTNRVWDVEWLEERGKMDASGWRMKLDVDGFWILGPEGEDIFWTPLPFRHARNTLVIGKCLKIDFSNFVHGDEWWKCQELL